MSAIETRIDGIPCIVKYSITGKYRPGDLYSPPEYEEVEMEVCDRRGRRAQWLERKLTEAEKSRIELECFEASSDW